MLEAEASGEQDIHGRSSECKLEEPRISYFFPGMEEIKNPRKKAKDQQRDEKSGGSAFRVVRRRGRTKWIKWIERDCLIKRARGALFFAKKSLRGAKNGEIIADTKTWFFLARLTHRVRRE